MSLVEPGRAEESLSRGVRILLREGQRLKSAAKGSVYVKGAASGGQWGPWAHPRKCSRARVLALPCRPCPAQLSPHAPGSLERWARLLGQGAGHLPPSAPTQEGGRQGKQGLGMGDATVAEVLARGRGDAGGHLRSGFLCGRGAGGRRSDLIFAIRDPIVYVSDQTRGHILSKLAECLFAPNS